MAHLGRDAVTQIRRFGGACRCVGFADLPVRCPRGRVPRANCSHCPAVSAAARRHFSGEERGMEWKNQICHLVAPLSLGSKTYLATANAAPLALHFRCSGGGWVDSDRGVPDRVGTGGQRSCWGGRG